MKNIRFKKRYIEKEYLGLKVRILIIDVYETGTDGANRILNISRHIWYQPSVEEPISLEPLMV